MDIKENCLLEHICPWGIRPVIGMWAKVEYLGHTYEFWGTNCVCYRHCPRSNWTDKQFKKSRESYKAKILK